MASQPPRMQEASHFGFKLFSHFFEAKRSVVLTGHFYYLSHMAEAPEEYHPRFTEENVEGVEVLENAPHRCLETFGNLSKLLRSHACL